MKSLAELEALKNSTLQKMNVLKDRKDGVRVVVGMATCGIAAGAAPVLEEMKKVVAEKGLKNVVVSQTGCIGMCRFEPIVEVYMPGEEKVMYCKMTADKVERVVTEHIMNGKPVVEYAIGSFDM